ncbi:unnamed protein product [Ceutorhynchus assimilis]|uniref:Uncharacterized protein n=1 Tax=Ceutorhynchus assimilis TaxID=467358 RepID=A0A9N9MHU1_9CUCU|nr:unnamed protein product [Ceutorhynchus assimilis]
MDINNLKTNELTYELELRNFANAAQLSVDEKRKLLRGCMKQESSNLSFVDPTNTKPFATDLKGAYETYADLVKAVDKFTGISSEKKKIEDRLTHLSNRINRFIVENDQQITEKASLQTQNLKQTEKLTKQIHLSETNVTKLLKATEKKVQKLEEKNVQLERKVRRNNIILYGLKKQNGDRNLVKDSITKINELLSTNFKVSDINNIYRLGKAPVLIEFLSFLKKSEIFNNPDKLRGLKDTGCAISNDLCEEDRRELNILRKYLKRAKEENKSARIKGLKLEIENKTYTAKELEQLDSASDSSGSELSETTGDETDTESGTEEQKKLSLDTKSSQPARENRKKRKKSNPSPRSTRSNKKSK